MKIILLLLFATILFSKPIDLSLEEKEFLQSHPKITLGVGEGWEPIAIRNNRGEITGFDVDILNEINKKTGANFTLEIDKWEKAQERAKNKELDGLSSLIQTPKRDEDFNFSNIFNSMDIIILTRKDMKDTIKSISDLDGKTIAIEKSNISHGNIAKSIAGIKIIYADTILETYKKVLDGSADVAIGHNSFEYLMTKEGLPKLAYAFKIGKSLDLRFAIRKDWPEAISILNKGLESISEKRLEQLKEIWGIYTITDPATNFLGLNEEELNYISNKKEIIVSNEFEYEPIDFFANDKPSGYSIDLLELLLKDTGLKIKYKTDNWTNLYEQFQEDKIDLVHTLYKSPEREKFMSFSKGYLQGVLSFVSRKDRETYQRIEQLFGKKVGVSKGWYQEIFLQKFPQIKKVYYPDLKSKLDALSNGEIDAIINNKFIASYFINKYGFYDLKVSNKIDNQLDKASSTFHFATKKDQAVLISILNKSFDKIPLSELDNLMKKWFVNGFDNNLFLTKEEKAYLENKKVLKMPTYRDWRPFNFVDKNSADGYLIELTKLIAKKLNVGLEFVHGFEWVDHMRMLKDKEVDFVANMVKTTKREETYTFTHNPTLVTAPGLVSNNGYKNLNELNDKIIGVQKGSIFEKIVKEKYPNLKLKEYFNMTELLEAVLNKDVDAIIENYSVLNYLINRMGLLDDKISINVLLDELGASFEMYYATSKDNKILINILNKAYDSFNQNTIYDLKRKWDIIKEESNNETTQNVKIDDTNDYFTILGLILSLILIVFIFIDSKKRIQQVEKEKQLLYEILNNSDINKDNSKNRLFKLNLKKYSYSLLALFALIVISLVVFETFLEKNNHFGELINKSGKQRMLSQRLIIEANDYVSTNQKNRLLYTQLLRNMKEDHQWIMTRLIFDEKMFYDSYKLDRLVLDYITKHEDMLKKPSAKLLQEIIIDGKTLLKYLDNAVKKHEYSYEESLKIFNLVKIIETVLMMALLYILWQYIFKPSFRRQEALYDSLWYEKEKVTQVKNEQNQLLSLFDKGDAVLFKWRNDPTWSIEYVSNNVENLFLHSKEDFLENKILYSSCICKEDLQRVFSEVTTAVENNSDFIRHKPYRIITKDNQEKWVLDVSTILREKDGKITHFIGYILDISEQKHIELELQNQKENYKQINKELELTVEKVNKANSAKSEFLANMSHEIRTPLNGIIGLNDILLHTNLSKDQLDYCKRIQNSSHALLNVLNDILDYSKIEAGKLDIIKQSFHLNIMLQTISDLFSYKAHSKDLEFSFLIDSNIPNTLVGDSLRLIQILNNLVGNAIKFTEKGYVLIRINLNSINHENKSVRLCFSVEDSGIGIDKEYQDKLFKSFEQVDNSTTRKYGGTGLGLMISKQLVELMGGSISFESKSDNGSKFYFNLDLEFVETKKLDSNIHNLPVLVVEDNDLEREYLKIVLNSWNAKVDEAKDGLEAIEKIKANKYELLLIDWKMPKMDGLELISYIQNNCEDVPEVLMVTAYSKDEVIKLAKSKDVKLKKLLTKPYTPSDLYNTIFENTPIFEAENINFEFKLKQTKKALLVEDNETNQIVANQMLSGIGFEVSIANNGIEAVEIISETDFDMVFMDLHMPLMDGFDATRKIREFDKQTPIIALSAAVMEKDRDLTLEVGMNEHLAKPIDKKMLLEVIDKYFGIEKIIKNTSELIENELILETIDYKKILKDFSNDEQKLIQLFLKFVNDYGDTSYLASLKDNKDELIDYIHKLKGLSGNLKITNVYKYAKQMNDKQKFDLLPELIIAINETCDEISKKLKPRLEIKSKFSKDELLEVLESFLLKVNNYEYLDFELSSRFITSLDDTLNEEEIKELKTAFDEMDYEKLEELLFDLQQKMKGN